MHNRSQPRLNTCILAKLYMQVWLPLSVCQSNVIQLALLRSSAEGSMPCKTQSGMRTSHNMYNRLSVCQMTIMWANLCQTVAAGLVLIICSSEPHTHVCLTQVISSRTQMAPVHRFLCNPAASRNPETTLTHPHCETTQTASSECLEE